MAHQVRFTVSERELMNSPVTFSIKKDGKAFGTLEVSKGGLAWFSKGKQYGPSLSWKAFESLIRSHE